MDYAEFKTDFIKQNWILKIVLLVNIVLFVLVILGFIFERRYYLFNGGALFNERPLVEEICKQGFVSLTEGDPSPYLVSKGIINLVEKEPLDIPIEKILQVKSLESGSCKIIFMSGRKLMAFKIFMLASDDNPFYYLINELEELAIDKEEL